MASFLDLPAESRLNIYRYLIPSIPIRNFLRLGVRNELLRTYSSVRHDGQPCATALLRTNRTVYDELVREWYGAVPYQVSIIDPGYILFCNREFKWDMALPRTIRFVTRLELHVSLWSWHDTSTTVAMDLLNIRKSVDLLGRSLGSRGDRCLRELLVCLDFEVPSVVIWEKSPLELLDYLAPLRAHVAGLQAVKWELRNVTSSFLDDEFPTSYNWLRGDVEAYLDQMRLEMLATGEDLHA